MGLVEVGLVYEAASRGKAVHLGRAVTSRSIESEGVPESEMARARYKISRLLVETKEPVLQASSTCLKPLVGFTTCDDPRHKRMHSSRSNRTPNHNLSNLISFLLLHLAFALKRFLPRDKQTPHAPAWFDL